jgi:hypothetical protein
MLTKDEFKNIIIADEIRKAVQKKQTENILRKALEKFFSKSGKKIDDVEFKWYRDGLNQKIKIVIKERI